ncbi:hypothetical protein QTG56_24135 (plasmid) [Rossellomorea sp. AcN35-11]|nr:hypothetical protein [Rossellomorea aquimaris]WJV31729.1 hypothetical protein QTG56_24135 [Rossellomorea sp. AcN35-11]
MEYSTKETLEKKINRVKRKIEMYKKEHGEHPSLTHTYHAGWSLGYWEGKLSLLEDRLDELEEL